LKPGEIRALLGENGAGKSTLMNIIFGIYHQDNGNILVNGLDVSKKWSPKIAMFHRIYMIHQYFMLVNSFTALQNIALPLLKWNDIKNNMVKYEKEIKNIVDEYNFNIRLKENVQDLSMGERQQIEIVKALYQKARVLILDEPTSVLIPQQVDNLLELMVNLRSKGYSIIFVTHKLKEAMAISDKITILREGKHIETLDRDKTTIDEVAYLMVGKKWITPIKKRSNKIGVEQVFKVNNLTVESEYKTIAIKDVSFSIKKGEIVGIAGVAGNGQTELSEAAIGTKKIIDGSILIKNLDITRLSIKKRQQEGLSYIPEDRHKNGMLGNMSVEENLIIRYIRNKPYSKNGILQFRAIKEKANQSIHNYNIKTSSANVPIINLSGGNQQKAVLARELMEKPSVIIACQPTAGLDFAATEYIRKELVKNAYNGVGLLIISEDIDELIELSDRILVIFNGEIVGNMSAKEGFDIKKIGLMMTGVSNKIM